MRVRLLTDREEAIVRAYVESGEKLEGFAVVKHRFNKTGFNVVTLEKQVILLDQFYDRLEAKK